MEATFINQLVALRRKLHQYPEVSGQEYQTQQRIKQFLEGVGVKGIQEVGKTGLLCTFDSAKRGPTLMIRGDIDALPIQEINTFEHVSTSPGVSHKCGHDGHATILCGLAKELMDEPLSRGSVTLLFQPAEEDGEGAKAVLSDSIFSINPDQVFALHNLPGYPLNQVVCREGSFTAAAKSILITLVGKTSHAAEPELGINPARAVSKIIELFEKLSRPTLSRDDFALATPIYMNLGSQAYGISAGRAEVHYTLRTWSNQVMEAFLESIEREVKGIAEEGNLELNLGYTQEFSANINNAVAVTEIREAARHLGLLYEERPTPFKWGEDFGLFTQRYKGAMFGIGAGETCPALHNPDYDFPDELIATGVSMFHSIIKRALE